MKFNNVYAVYFSPTGGTKKYVKKIAEMFSGTFKEIDLTFLQKREMTFEFLEEDLVIIGAPVYGGRLPDINLFHNLKGKNTKSIFVVTYGNRDYEDALLEEADICKKNGFVCIGAAALIAPHSFSDKVASNRPDEMDIKKLQEFVDHIHEKDEDNLADLKLKGNYPFKEFNKIPFFPVGGDNCNGCMKCVEHCTMGAISKDNPKSTDISKCIACVACVKICPEKSRQIVQPEAIQVLSSLENFLLTLHKEPEFFV